MSIMMASAADVTTRSAQAAATTQTAGDGDVFSVLVGSFFAAGTTVLLACILVRIARPGKLRLENCPARVNTVNPIPILLVLLMLMLTQWGTDAILSHTVGTTGKWLIVHHLITPSVMLACSLLVAAMTFRGGLVRGIGLSARHWVFDTERALIAFLAVLPICLSLLILVKLILPTDAQHTHALLTTLPNVTPLWKLLGALAAIVMAPLAEEIFFRGLLQSMLRRYLRSPWLAILLTSAIFAVAHRQNIQDLPSLFALSVMLGYAYERSGRLFTPILIHAMFNALFITDALTGSQLPMVQ